MSGLDIQTLFSQPGAPAYPFRDDRGQLCWLEALTEDGGRLALKQQTAEGERIITPADFQIRSRVHEYGGKCFCIIDDQIYFNNFHDGRIYRQSVHDNTPPVACSKSTVVVSQFADLHYSAALNLLFAIEEVEAAEVAENQNRLVAIPLGKSEPQAPQVLVQASDFYAAPCVSDNGEQLAWLQWNHPDMPWDASYLMCANISNTKGSWAIEQVEQVAGGEHNSVCQPGFLRNGVLVYAMDRKADAGSALNYWNMYQWIEGTSRAITQDRVEYGEAHWVFGQCRWVQISDSELLFIATQDESDQLVAVDLRSNTQKKMGTPCARLSQLSSCNGAFVYIAEHSDRPVEILGGDSEGANDVLKAPPSWLAAAEVCLPELIIFPTRDGASAYANYYPAFNTPLGQKPALLILVHGGPTSRADMGLSPLVQYFTHQGFSVLDVNHRGSTGHGREYRQALLGQWGEIDAEDIADAIEFLVQQKQLDAKSVFIRGGSAGGYAVLRALTRFPALFCGGACYYGIGNLITLAEITHKFEARYTDRLIGEVYKPETAGQAGSRFRSRSPIFDIDRISSPLILFQGLEDRVVPPEVSREMVATLEKNHIRHEYIEYPGEGHGFRQARTRIDALEREIAFYREILAKHT